MNRTPAKRPSQHRLEDVLLLAACAAVLAGSPRAPLAQQPSRSAYRNVGASCAPEVARYCPLLLRSPGQYRNQAICLRPYRANLSLRCRRAVRTVFR